MNLKLILNKNKVFIPNSRKYLYLSSLLIEFILLKLLYDCCYDEIHSSNDNLIIYYFFGVWLISSLLYYWCRRKNSYTITSPNKKINLCRIALIFVFFIKFSCNIIIVNFLEKSFFPNSDTISNKLLTILGLYIIFILLSEIFLLLENRSPIYFLLLFFVIITLSKISINNTIFNWALIYLLLVSIKDFFNTKQINYQISCKRKRINLEKHNQKISINKITCAILIPLIYILLSLSDYVTSCQIVNNKITAISNNNGFLKLVYLGEIKLILIIFPILFVFLYRTKIMNLLINK